MTRAANITAQKANECGLDRTSYQVPADEVVTEQKKKMGRGGEEDRKRQRQRSGCGSTGSTTGLDRRDRADRASRKDRERLMGRGGADRNRLNGCCPGQLITRGERERVMECEAGEASKERVARLEVKVRGRGEGLSLLGEGEADAGASQGPQAPPAGSRTARTAVW